MTRLLTTALLLLGLVVPGWAGLTSCERNTSGYVICTDDLLLPFLPNGKVVSSCVTPPCDSWRLVPLEEPTPRACPTWYFGESITVKVANILALSTDYTVWDTPDKAYRLFITVRHVDHTIVSTLHYPTAAARDTEYATLQEALRCQGKE